jgi:hypothetical protein
MSEYAAENKPLSPEFVPPEPEPQVPAAQEEAAWTGPSQEEWQQWQQANEYLAEQLQEAQKALTPQQQAQLDPFADDFQSQLDAYIAQKVQPYEDLRTNVSMGEAEERANDILTDLQSAKVSSLTPNRKLSLVRWPSSSSVRSSRDTGSARRRRRLLWNEVTSTRASAKRSLENLRFRDT